MISKLARLFLFLFLSFFALYFLFLSIISISIGFGNIERPGFWMPIVCGVLILLLMTSIIRLMLYLYKQTQDKEKGYI